MLMFFSLLYFILFEWFRFVDLAATFWLFLPLLALIYVLIEQWNDLYVALNKCGWFLSDTIVSFVFWAFVIVLFCCWWFWRCHWTTFFFNIRANKYTELNTESIGFCAIQADYRCLWSCRKKIWPWSISHRIFRKNFWSWWIYENHILRIFDFNAWVFRLSLVRIRIVAFQWLALRNKRNGILRFFRYWDTFFQQNEDVHRLFWYFACARWSP